MLRRLIAHHAHLFVRLATGGQVSQEQVLAERAHDQVLLAERDNRVVRAAEFLMVLVEGVERLLEICEQSPGVPPLAVGGDLRVGVQEAVGALR
jgi:hypothetical protein